MSEYPLPSGRMGGILRIIGELPQMGDKKESVWSQIVEEIDGGADYQTLVRKWPAQAVKNEAAVRKYMNHHDHMNAKWRDIETTYITGGTGSGKTRYVMDKYGYPNVFRVQNYDGNGAFDNYNGQDVIVFEEFRNGFKIQEMLNYLDGYPCELPARYAHRFAKFTKVFIISNWTLEEQYQGIQENHPSTWQALLRRISTYGTIEEGEYAPFVDVLDHLRS
jgi:hypothetical protein